MIAPKIFGVTPLACLLLGSMLTLACLSSGATAGAETSAAATVSVADLERLAQQIADPQQREQLLNTLQALVTLARQGHAAAPAPPPSDILADRAQGLFFAFGELTQRLAMSVQHLIHRLATMPVMMVGLPRRLTDPTTLRSLTVIALLTISLVLAGVGLQRFTVRLEGKLRPRITASEPRSWWRKVWLALLSIGLAVAPYIALLGFGGLLCSMLPVGVVPAGLAALVISTILLYRFLRATARALLAPDAPHDRLLPLGDGVAQRVWRWVSRMIALGTLYVLTTRMLLTVGVAREFYQGVRGSFIIVIASVVSVMIVRLGRVQRTEATAVGGDQSRRWPSLWATLWGIWPVLAVAYVWCMALLALLGADQQAIFLVTASLQVTLLIGTGIALLWAVDLVFQHATALNARIGGSIPGLERRTRRYVRALWWGSRLLVLLIVVLAILQVWGVGVTSLIASPLGGGLLSRLITLALTATVVGIIVDLSTFIGQKLVESTPAGVEPSKKRKTLVPLTAAVIKYGALSTGGLIALHQVGVDITPILAGVGILSLAVGFGAQTLVKDIINGLFMLVEDSIAVGDVVTIRGTGGSVEAVNLRTIRLRDLQGHVHVIPNSQVEMITNMTRGYAYAVLDVSVAYREDPDAVIQVLQEIDAGMRADPAFAADILAPIEIFGVERFADSAMVLRARLQTKPGMQWGVGREFNRRMKKLFEARGIEIPLPQRTLSWAEPKRNGTVPLRLHIDNLEAPALAVGQAHRTEETHPPT
jgi:small conductance mechanosensitive channel